MRKTEEPEWNGVFRQNPFHSRMFTRTKMEEVEEKLIHGVSAVRRISPARWTAVSALVAASAAIVLFLLLPRLNVPAVKDNATPAAPSFVEAKTGTRLIEYKDDAMLRGKAEYMSDYHGPLVLDPGYYSSHPMDRGDVVYFKSPDPRLRITAPVPNPDDIIARIVALPGEKIAIRQGQVFIDGKKLDTFYGKALYGGQDEETYFEHLNAPGSGVCNEECQTGMREFFHKEMQEVQVPAQHVFVMSDTWLRSVDSLSFGPLPLANVQGKILGYEQQKPSPLFRSGSYDLQGIKGKLGVLGVFKAGQPNKYMWHFWGSKDELFRDTTFRVVGLHYESGFKRSVLIGNSPAAPDNSFMPVPVEDTQGPLGGPNNGADAHFPTAMMLPKPGLWRLDVYIGAKLFGSINVEAGPSS